MCLHKGLSYRRALYYSRNALLRWVEALSWGLLSNHPFGESMAARIVVSQCVSERML